MNPRTALSLLAAVVLMTIMLVGEEGSEGQVARIAQRDQAELADAIDETGAEVLLGAAQDADESRNPWAKDDDDSDAGQTDVVIEEDDESFLIDFSDDADTDGETATDDTDMQTTGFDPTIR